MEAEEFRRRVVEGGREIRLFPTECAEMAAELLVAAGLTESWHVTPATTIAEELNKRGWCGAKKLRVQAPERTVQKRVEAKLRDPDGFKAAAALRLPQLEAWVSGLRTEVRRRVKGTFETEDDVIAWLKEGATRGWQSVPWALLDYNTRLTELVDEYEDLVGARPEIQDVLLGAVITPPGHEPIFVGPSTAQAVLVEETRAMSQGSGFPQWEIVLYVLLDQKPRLDGWRLTYTEPNRKSRLVDGASISAPVAHVVFDGPIEHVDLTQLHHELRDAWKSHDESDAERALEERVIQEVASERGEVKKSRPFFEEVCRRLMAAGVSLRHNDPTKDWKNAKQRYHDREKAKK